MRSVLLIVMWFTVFCVWPVHVMSNPVGEAGFVFGSPSDHGVTLERKK